MPAEIRPGDVVRHRHLRDLYTVGLVLQGADVICPLERVIQIGPISDFEVVRAATDEAFLLTLYAMAFDEAERRPTLGEHARELLYNHLAGTDQEARHLYQRRESWRAAFEKTGMEFRKAEVNLREFATGKVRAILRTEKKSA